MTATHLWGVLPVDTAKTILTECTQLLISGQIGPDPINSLNDLKPMAKRVLILACFLIVIGIAGLALLNFQYPHYFAHKEVQSLAINQAKNITEEDAAPKGELYSGFPKELILDDTAQITGSSFAPYSRTYKAFLQTHKTSKDVQNLYNNFFTVNGYAAQIESGNPVKISATKMNRLVNIQIQDFSTIAPYTDQ